MIEGHQHLPWSCWGFSWSVVIAVPSWSDGLCCVRSSEVCVPRYLKVKTPSTLLPFISGGRWSSFFLLKSMISSLVFVMFRAKLLTVRQSVSLRTSSSFDWHLCYGKVCSHVCAGHSGKGPKHSLAEHLCWVRLKKSGGCPSWLSGQLVKRSHIHRQRLWGRPRSDILWNSLQGRMVLNAEL